MTYDGSFATLYGNGSVVAGPSAASGTVVNNSVNYKVGRRGDFTVGVFEWDGGLADFAIWNTGLSALEVAALAKGVRPNSIRQKSLQIYYPLDGLASPEPDLSGNARNGTVHGTSRSFGPPVAPFTSRWPQVTPVSTPSAASLVFAAQTLTIPLLVTGNIKVTIPVQ